MLDEEWKEAEALAARCEADPWTLDWPEQPESYLHGGAVFDKRGIGVAEVYIDERRIELPEHTSDEADDARDLEAMRRLFPLLFKIAKYGQKLLDAVNS